MLVPDHTVAVHLYRIAREAASNAIKRGKARRIEISLTANGNAVTVPRSSAEPYWWNRFPEAAPCSCAP